MARTAKRKKSKALIDSLGQALRYADMSERPLYCWKLKEMGIDYSEEQRTVMQEAHNDHEAAIQKVKSVYAELIGSAVVEEVSKGDWRGK